MNRTTRYWALGILAPLTLAAIAGCGSHNAPLASGHHHHKHHHHRGGTAAPSSSPSSAAPSSSTAPPSSSSVPVESPSTPPSPVLTGGPQAGGVAGPNQVQATVNRVQADGTAQVNGQTDYVYSLNVTLKNPTTAMILFSLNDIVVGPAGSKTSHSLNDYDMQGITQQNSLFPYPIVPTHPGAVVVRVPSGQSVTGDFTAEVPSASSYAVSIVGTSGAIATFSA
ncbi:MAG: hypothetical protein M0Z36_13990 [Thermaerobacter sp.]|nr:hypothetical protein [Thermaerobacter sp.]